MANPYSIPATCSSSSSPPEATDDISLFLRQILHKSSSSTSYSSPLQPVFSSRLSVPDRIPNLSSPTAGFTPTNAATNVSSSSVGTIDNDPDEYDCESEEGFENLTKEQMAGKSNLPRNPAKRIRAAEVHNLSEKRRRSRINEKMKALQKLIPNSNKTDKASMLDEAIEYLKQLQLRLQMLTMRNGMSLYSMSVPSGVLQPQQFPHSRTGLLQPENMVSLNQESQVNPVLSLPNQCTNRNQPSIPELSHIINPGSSSSFWESLMNSNGSEGAQMMNSQQKLVLPVSLDGNCTRNESYDGAKR